MNRFRLFLLLTCIQILCFWLHLSAYKYELSVCAIFQNEARFMKEWLDFYRLAGVEHFWLYNNDSTDEYAEVLEPYIKDGIVELIYWPNITPDVPFPFGCQSSAYSDAVNRAKEKTEWLIMIDLDEFIFPRKGTSIINVIKKHYKDESGVYIYWQKFGTSHVQQILPNEVMIEKLTWKANEGDDCNKWYKTIFRPKAVKKVENPHLPCYIEKMPVDATKRFQLNHYWTRDEMHLYITKCSRYTKWEWKIEEILKEAYKLNAVQDKSIQKYVPLLKKMKYFK